MVDICEVPDTKGSTWLQTQETALNPHEADLEPESFGAFLAYLFEEGRKNGHGSFSWADRSSYEAENVQNEVERDFRDLKAK